MNYKDSPFPRQKYYERPIYDRNCNVVGCEKLALTNGIYYLTRLPNKRRSKKEHGQVYFARRFERNKYQYQYLLFLENGKYEYVCDIDPIGGYQTQRDFKVEKMPSFNKIMYELKICK